jgi:hypothetical protein
MMRIKKFDSFVSESLNEDSSHYEGKNKFSKWLRGVSDRIKSETDDTNFYSRYSDPRQDPYITAKRATAVIPAAFRLIAGAGAAVADFFSKGDNKDSVSKYSKEDLSSKKKEIIDKWESEHIKSDTTEADAEKFYKSGVLKGKKFFGPDYDPIKPKNRDEEIYTDYINGVMERYYKKTSKYAR